MRTRRLRHGGSRCGTRPDQSGWCSRDRSFPCSIARCSARPQDTARGAYVLADAQAGSRPELILIATGSEVSLALEAHRQLSGEGVRSRVVSMPCWELFEAQPKEYRDAVLPPDVTSRVSVEAASPFGWERYVGAGRRDHWYRSLRRLGARPRGDEAIRIHGGACDRDGETSARGRHETAVVRKHATAARDRIQSVTCALGAGPAPPAGSMAFPSTRPRTASA